MTASFQLKELIEAEIIQLKQEGFVVPDYSIDSLSQSELMDLYYELKKCKKDDAFPFEEPEELDRILAGAADYKAESRKDKEYLFDKYYGAWLGRIIGCIIGKPFERSPYSDGTGKYDGWQCIKMWQEGAGKAFPPDDYVSGVSSAKEKNGFEIGCELSLKENIKFAESDDDIRYLVLGLLINEKYGNGFTTADVSRMWRTYLTPSMVFTAEHRALVNSLICQKKDEKEQLEFCHGFLNPYREWIGAQIRVDHYGYYNAGDPVAAAKSAYNDAVFSHTKNGVYGAMFIAALISLAFTETDTLKCIEIAKTVIPEKSRLRADIDFAVALAESTDNAEEIYKALRQRFRDLSPVHTNNNAAVCVAALIYGKGDFTRSVSFAVGAGWDTDCNGATVGSFVGAQCGEKAIPAYLKEPLNDTLYSSVIDFHPAKISDCAKRSMNAFLAK